MSPEVRSSSLETVHAVHSDIPEFDEGDLEEKYREKGVEEADPALLTATREEEQAGYLIAYDKFGDGSYYVWMAGVVPGHRREGVMSAMIHEIEDIAREKGYDSVKIKTRNERREMRHFLVDQGFDVCGFDPVGDLERHEILHVKEL